MTARPAPSAPPAAGTPTPRPPESTAGAAGGSSGGVGGDPLTRLVYHLRRDGKPPLPWIVAHCPDGDLTRLWAASTDIGAMEWLALGESAGLRDALYRATSPWGEAVQAWRGFTVTGRCGRVRVRVTGNLIETVELPLADAARLMLPVPPTLAQLLAPPAKGPPP
jgi:hypothetical protein